VFLSLRHANRQILRSNKIEEDVDDFVYLKVRMAKKIRDVGTRHVSAATPVQIELPKDLNAEEALLIVRDGER